MRRLCHPLYLTCFLPHSQNKVLMPQKQNLNVRSDRRGLTRRMDNLNSVLEPPTPWYAVSSFGGQK